MLAPLIIITAVYYVVIGRPIHACSQQICACFMHRWANQITRMDDTSLPPIAATRLKSAE